MAEPAPTPTLAAPRPRSRLDSVDLLRGIAMVLMALDHVRDFVSDARFEPEDLDKTTPALFFTRWVTHFCAPIFVFLAGTGAYLSKKPKRALARFLVTRGAWLIVLELTIVSFGWTFDLSYRGVGVQVIWALGWCMIALAGLIFLPLRAIAALGVAMIGLHDLLDGVHARDLGDAEPLWLFLHEPGFTKQLGVGIYFAYPLIPWIGVMAVGFAFGELLEADAALRRRRVLWLGAALTGAFVALRLVNVYGDASPFVSAHGVLSFLNCTKYPPSLLYLLMTLGPALLALGALDRVTHAASRPILVFGRVPLFFYLVHLPVIHGLALALGYARYGRALPSLFSMPFGEGDPPFPAGYGYALPIVYLVWIAVVLGLYPACAWFARVKSRSRRAWLSYL